VLSGELAAIKRERGGNSYRLLAEGDVERLRALPAVEDVAATNGMLRVRAASGVDGPALLRQLVGVVEVREFRSAEPTLEEIFVQAVRDANV
jgi:ABC-type uncharacterized transport system ATPase subunit